MLNYEEHGCSRTSTLDDPGYLDQSQDVIQIRIGTGSRSESPSSVFKTRSVSIPSLASTSTPSFGSSTQSPSASPFLSPQVQAPSPGTSSQPPPTASLKETPTRKRKIEKSSEPNANTQTILGAMANAVTELNASKGIPSSCAMLVQKTCEKLTLMHQVRLLGKLSKLMEDTLLEAGVAVECV